MRDDFGALVAFELRVFVSTNSRDVGKLSNELSVDGEAVELAARLLSNFEGGAFEELGFGHGLDRQYALLGFVDDAGLALGPSNLGLQALIEHVDVVEATAPVALCSTEEDDVVAQGVADLT